MEHLNHFLFLKTIISKEIKNQPIEKREIKQTMCVQFKSYLTSALLINETYIVIVIVLET